MRYRIAAVAAAMLVLAATAAAATNPTGELLKLSDLKSGFKVKLVAEKVALSDELKGETGTLRSVDAANYVSGARVGFEGGGLGLQSAVQIYRSAGAAGQVLKGSVSSLEAQGAKTVSVARLGSGTVLLQMPLQGGQETILAWREGATLSEISVVAKATVATAVMLKIARVQDARVLAAAH